MVRYLTLASVLLAAQAGAQSSYPYGYFRFIDGTVTLQRATEPEPEDASFNMPVMPGDRAWTRSDSRAEVQFENGSILRMDERTKLDFVSLGDQENLVRIWSGSVIVSLVDPRGGGFRIDAPGGSVFPAADGVFRIDVDESGDVVTLSTFEGVAELASEGGSVLVRSGQRSVTREGDRPEQAFDFNSARWDDFASWSDNRDRQASGTRGIDGVPEPVNRYAGELEAYGDWRWDSSYGNVWYPTTITVGWSPYNHGRWVYTAYGWTWVSYEPWGWAPYHYGRWGYGSFGWYWIPGAHWGPAWVSWAVGPSWLGWCPLGYYDRPVVHYDTVFYRGGHAVPRNQGAGWTFSRGNSLGAAWSTRARLRAEDVRDTATQAQVLESGAILDRNFRPRVVGAAAMTRIPRTGFASGSTTAPVVGRGASSFGRGRDITPAPNARRQEPDNTSTRIRVVPPSSWGNREPSERSQESGTRTRERSTTPYPDRVERREPRSNDGGSSRARSRSEGSDSGRATTRAPSRDSGGGSRSSSDGHRSGGGGASATRKSRER